MAEILDSSGGPLLDWLGRPILDSDGYDLGPAAHYTASLLAALPSGRVWPKSVGSNLYIGVSAMALMFHAIDLRASYLLHESPAADSLLELLPDWESSLGLPDECSGQLPTIVQRQQAVRAKLAARGGQSVPYFVAIAAQLGIAITVQEFTPSRFGRPFGQPFAGADAAHTWKVTVPNVTLVPFVFGEGRFGEPFGTYGSQLLTCILNRFKPAHTALVSASS